MFYFGKFEVYIQIDANPFNIHDLTSTVTCTFLITGLTSDFTLICPPWGMLQQVQTSSSSLQCVCNISAHWVVAAGVVPLLRKKRWENIANTAQCYLYGNFPNCFLSKKIFALFPQIRSQTTFTHCSLVYKASTRGHQPEYFFLLIFFPFY